MKKSTSDSTTACSTVTPALAAAVRASAAVLGKKSLVMHTLQGTGSEMGCKLHLQTPSMTHKVMHTLVTLRHENRVDCGCKCWDSTPEVWNGVSFAAEAFAGLPHIQCLAMTYSMVEWYWASHADTQHSKRAGL